MGNFLHFYGCTGNGGEFLISKGFDTVQLFSIDPDNQSENNQQDHPLKVCVGIQDHPLKVYTTNFMESLVLLKGKP